jgi:hypothetical protein
MITPTDLTVFAFFAAVLAIAQFADQRILRRQRQALERAEAERAARLAERSEIELARERREQVELAEFSREMHREAMKGRWKMLFDKKVYLPPKERARRARGA